MGRYLNECLESGVCPRCDQPRDDIDEQYSYGVYAGVMCHECAFNAYRDHCGLGLPLSAIKKLAEQLVAELGKPDADMALVESLRDQIAFRGEQGSPADLDEPYWEE